MFSNEINTELLIQDQVKELTSSGHAFAEVVQSLADQEWDLQDLLLQVWKARHERTLVSDPYSPIALGLRQAALADAAARLAEELDVHLQRLAATTALALAETH